MIFFTSNFEELERLPEGVELLVFAEGLMWVEMVGAALRRNNVYHYTAAERKDEVEFYVQKKHRSEVEKTVKKYCTDKEQEYRERYRRMGYKI
ncbi:MAG TPA: hypothetical protein VJC21_00510 [Candidatus Nanoarchaeia archaeon]|nr:hypothetical protein [Candidatus Nanoarchaeia archaeon]